MSSRVAEKVEADPIEGSQKFEYRHYTADVPALCDLAFRKFVTNTVFNGAILIPVRSGPGRKFTTEGVVKVLAVSEKPGTTEFMSSILSWTQITEFIYERYRKEQSTKVYFRGFPLDTTLGQISSYFGYCGPLQYVYVMCDSNTKQRSNKQGYIIYESRSSVERLFQSKTELYFKGCQIYVEEYKTKCHDLLAGKVVKGTGTETDQVHNLISEAIRSSNHAEFPIGCLEDESDPKEMGKKGPYNLTAPTRDCSNVNSKQVSKETLLKLQTINSLTNIETKKRFRLRTFLLFRQQIDANSNPANLRFNRESRQ